ncbi:hypothetical protein KBK19_02410 [Microvirga sp. STR05]|uniref:Uncharacterized protein n=1 Tax=Hymenobacter duratus TaxID=2771356 RepID=A0ABR8JE99_9BACT|nr:hypothetical protein [Hymenobacter duratus]MBD2713883.1 hypothetical protein [Hymenobacter duratus]MBR7948785.1 hypothetical protein [Microvirga sp. STR05]
MADINIQRKKSSPSPWLLILLVLAVVGAAAWYLLRHDDPQAGSSPSSSVEQTVSPAPDTTTGAETGPRPADAEAVGDMASEAAPVTPEVLAGFAKTNPAQPGYSREGLRLLTSALVELADRDDLRDAAVSEKRDGLTSATARLAEPNTSVRPGFVAAAGLMQAMQQKRYPVLEPAVAELVGRATQLSGRTETAADQKQTQEFFVRAAEIVRTLSEPAS